MDTEIKNFIIDILEYDRSIADPLSVNNIESMRDRIKVIEARIIEQKEEIRKITDRIIKEQSYQRNMAKALKVLKD